MIDAPDTGPTPHQEDAFRTLIDGADVLLPRLLAAVASKREETQRPPGRAYPRAISVPALDSRGPGGTGGLWTIWFDYENEAYWSYGVQSNDDWTTVSAFAED
jgi:hypothetical protein